MSVTIIAHHLCTVNKNAIVLLTVNQKYYGLKLLYEYLSYCFGVIFYVYGWKLLLSLFALFKQSFYILGQLRGNGDKFTCQRLAEA